MWYKVQYVAPLPRLSVNSCGIPQIKMGLFFFRGKTVSKARLFSIIVPIKLSCLTPGFVRLLSDLRDYPSFLIPWSRVRRGDEETGL